MYLAADMGNLVETRHNEKKQLIPTLTARNYFFKNSLTKIRSVNPVPPSSCQNGVHRHKRIDGTIRTANPNRTVSNIFDLAHHNQHSCQADRIINDFWKECTW
jgi:hypothetical protein